MLLIVAPRFLLRLVAGREPDASAVWFARVLGARQVTEAAALAAGGSAGWMRAGAAVDGIHAATAVVLAARRPTPEHRRELLVNAVVAAVVAADGARRAYVGRGYHRG